MAHFHRTIGTKDAAVARLGRSSDFRNGKHHNSKRCGPRSLSSQSVCTDGGVHRGELLVVAGETSGGKSMLLSMAVLASARAGKKVALFRLEMSARDILRRMAANIAGFPIKGVHEKPNDKEMDVATRAICALSSLPITIFDNLATLTSIESEVRRLTRLKNADVVIIDYLQLVENSAADSREQAVAEVARKFKNLASGCGCVVFTASQLNDDGKLRESAPWASC